jgi:hypothetical protein
MVHIYWDINYYMLYTIGENIQYIEKRFSNNSNDIAIL